MSEAIKAAQRRLFALRAQHRSNDKANVTPNVSFSADAADCLRATTASAAQNELLKKRAQHRPSISAERIGRPRDAAAFASICERIEEIDTRPLPTEPVQHTVPTPSAACECLTPDETKDSKAPLIATYPAISAAASRAGEISTYRIWCLLMHRYGKSGGWVGRAEAIALCTAELKLFKSRRRIEQILKAGQGKYWKAGCDRLYLIGAGRVAGMLSADVVGRKIYIEEPKLTGGIKLAKAAFYATFHSGRKRGDRPISRIAVTNATGHSGSTQRTYERVASVDTYTNYATAPEPTSAELEQWHFKHGDNAFVFIDYKGKQGKAGARYIARQLPNTYSHAAQVAPRGRQKKVQRQAKDFVNSVRAKERGRERLYYQPAEVGRVCRHKRSTDVHVSVVDTAECGKVYAVWILVK